jgi:hypothetical protein
MDACGRFIGRQMFWKLYVIENTLRIAIHSVLSAQLGGNWLAQSLSPRKLIDLQNFRNSYTASPNHANPGQHDIYLTFLSDLTRIIARHNGLFLPIIPDINQWIVNLERIRFSRNIVGHMNFPNAYDRQQIDTVHANIGNLLLQIASQGVPILVP